MENTTPKFDVEKATEFVYTNFDKSALPSLIEFIKIPNLSRAYDKEWETNGLLLKAAEHIKSWIEGFNVRGLKSEIIVLEGKSPIVYTEVEGQLPYTIFYYGHYDKQPPFEGWWEGFGPNIPVIKDGKLYGRGGADDGYATYGTFLSIKACQEQGIKLPKCIMITQGDEESGSAHMSAYLDHLKKRIGKPQVCFCLDSGTINYDTFFLTNSLRGMLSMTIKVEVLEQGVHSGDASGIVPSSLRVMRQLLDRIEDAQTGELIPELYADIPPNRYKQLYQCAQQLKQGAVKPFPFVKGVSRVTSNVLNSVLARGWDPKLEVVGASGLPQASTAGNVLRPQTTFKLSFRLPPILDSHEAKKIVEKRLTQNPPYGAKVTVDNFTMMNGWNAPSYSNYLQSAISQASNHFYKQNHLTMAEGGTIPLMGMFAKAFPESEFIVTGILGPQSNAHGPNEFLHIDYTKKLIAAMTMILARTSSHFQDLARKQKK